MKINKVWMATALYILLAFSVGLILNDGLIIFLGINIGLASITYFLSNLFLKKYEQKKKTSTLLLLGVLFVLFFPNTFYVLTDVIHFQESQFFERYPDVYHAILKEWIGFFIIMLGVFHATYLGIFSLKKITRIIKHDKVRLGIITLLLFLSSIGIYIGRFLRLNSWQFFRLDLIFQGIFDSFSFFIGFICIVTLLEGAIYFLTTSVFKADQ